MAPEEHLIDPRFAVEMGDARFDPKDAAVVARWRAAAAARRLASALGVAADAIPGAERPAYLLQFEHDPSAKTVRRFRTEYGLQLTEGPSPVAFVERMDRRTAARVRRDPAVRHRRPAGGSWSSTRTRSTRPVRRCSRRSSAAPRGTPWSSVSS